MFFYGIFGLACCMWTLRPFLDKWVIRKGKNVLDISILRFLFSGLIGLIALFIAYITLNTKSLLNYDKTIYIYTFTLSLITFLTTNIWYYLLSKYGAAFMIAMIGPITIITTLIVGYFFFNENITYQQIIGTIIICIGLVTLILDNSKKNKNNMNILINKIL